MSDNVLNSDVFSSIDPFRRSNGAHYHNFNEINEPSNHVSSLPTNKINSADSNITSKVVFPWQIERKPWFTIDVGWKSIFWLIIITIIIIFIIWLFTGGKSRKFVGIPIFDINNKPSDILDEDTMQFLQITDSIVNHPINQSYITNNHDEHDEQDEHDEYDEHDDIPQISISQVTPIISTRSIVNVQSGVSTVYSNRYSNSQPAEIILTNGNINSYDHLAPSNNTSSTSSHSGTSSNRSSYPITSMFSTEKSDSNSGINNESTNETSDNDSEININDLLSDDIISNRRSDSIIVSHESSELFEQSPHIKIDINKMIPPNPTPRYEDLNLGTFAERKSRAESKGERICREFMQRYYGKIFKQIRPDFLKNPLTNRNLELDGYNAELSLAFEYNGVQHYEYPNIFHKTKKEFEQQLSRDNYKRRVCDRVGIYLINIPYTVPYDKIPDYIKDRLPHNINK